MVWDTLFDSVIEGSDGGFTSLFDTGPGLDVGSVADYGGGGAWGSMGDVFGDSGGDVDPGAGFWSGADGGGGGGATAGTSVGADGGAMNMGGNSGLMANGAGVASASPWGGLATSLLGAMAGPAIGAGIGAIGGMLAPDKPQQIISTNVGNPPTVVDPRTQQGQAGDDLRLKGANLNDAELQRVLGDPYGGTISPQQQSRAMYEISRQIRKANSAAGNLETGAGVAREQEALDQYRRARETEHYNYVNSRFGSIPGLTQFGNNTVVPGTPNQLTTVGGQANPWQRLIAGAGAAAGQAVSQAQRDQAYREMLQQRAAGNWVV